MSYPDYRLVYFLTDQELIDIHKASGGTLGNFNVNSFDDTEHARQFIFNYLCPHPVRHWYASLGHESGAAFMVGKTTRNIRKAMKPDLQEKCKSMFNRGPNYCLPVPGANGLKWEMFFNDEKSRILVLDEFMGVGDLYPYRPEGVDNAVAFEKPVAIRLQYHCWALEYYPILIAAIVALVYIRARPSTPDLEFARSTPLTKRTSVFQRGDANGFRGSGDG
ncbi:hypothetical protein AG1IA_07068 [Rhizoctonia solani AG-1 IA]|uniref:Uncharacterized protein n=1 Tax=Thanatephorus cucumeris (strain AG1-IA) TaxID=983506 RepID=L8WL56_THACA|nr:hypothetical protein AG1IA_07068 [Rhizoctonia solani AG-1 IA]